MVVVFTVGYERLPSSFFLYSSVLVTVGSSVLVKPGPLPIRANSLWCVSGTSAWGRKDMVLCSRLASPSRLQVSLCSSKLRRKRLEFDLCRYFALSHSSLIFIKKLGTQFLTQAAVPKLSLLTAKKKRPFYFQHILNLKSKKWVTDSQSLKKKFRDTLNNWSPSGTIFFFFFFFLRAKESIKYLEQNILFSPFINIDLSTILNSSVFFNSASYTSNRKFLKLFGI
jgi:hypothetical protein